MYHGNVPPDKRDVESMVVALFTLIAGIDRATRLSKGASTLSLLQVVAGHEAIRPSEIADIVHVHPSLVTRQVRELERMGYVEVRSDPADRRASLVSVTSAGADEVRLLQQMGLERFATFVADWDPEEVRMLRSLLEKLEQSKAAVGESERRAAARREKVPA
jgi:DNA-binding MarR family transcriptional regulator